MKSKFKIFISAACLSFLAIGCSVDNYDAPGCHIKGRIVYEGEPLGVKGTESSVTMELWERGYGKETPQVVYVGQDGAFSTYVYGEHPVRIVAKDGVGPWENRHDTVYIDKVGGETVVDYPVVPYFVIKNLKYEMSADSVLTATFTVKQVSENAKIGNAGLLVNKTRFVDLTASLKSSGVAKVGDLSVSIDLKNEMKSERFLYARVYVKTDGIDQALYSVDPYKVK